MECDEKIGARIRQFMDDCNTFYEQGQLSKARDSLFEAWGILPDEKYIYDETNVELGIYKDKAKKPIGIQNLSSGEKQIISVFSKLYIENIEKCIILFDEPELSLSIKWQNMFLPDVVNSGKCSTLIAVTHSPFIFDNEFDDLAKDMGNCLSENE